MRAGGGGAAERPGPNSSVGRGATGGAARRADGEGRRAAEAMRGGRAKGGMRTAGGELRIEEGGDAW